MSPIHLPIKPSPSNCNMRCNYCLYCDITEHRKQASCGFTSGETLEQAMKKALGRAEGECSFSHQGGEPTLRSLVFFERSLEFEKEHSIHGMKISHAPQASDYRLNGDWAKFLTNNHFLVDVPLDESKSTHGTYRRSVKGEETFSNIIKTTDILNEYQVEFNIPTMIDRWTAGKVHKAYQFYEENHLNYSRFVPCLNPSGEQQGDQGYSLMTELYNEFLKDLFDSWYGDLLKDEQPYIYQFESYIAVLMGHHPEACDQSGVYNCQYMVEANREVYPCDFYMLGEYKLGNLNDCSTEGTDEERHEIGFMEYSLTGREACRKCRRFLICRGDYHRHYLPEEADDNHGNVSRDSYLASFGHAMLRMVDIARCLSR